MFEARILATVEGQPCRFISLEDLKKIDPAIKACEVLVESGGEGRSKGSSKMTLRRWNKETGYCARYVPLTSTPRIE